MEELAAIILSSLSCFTSGREPGVDIPSSDGVEVWLDMYEDDLEALSACDGEVEFVRLPENADATDSSDLLTSVLLLCRLEG